MTRYTVHIVCVLMLSSLGMACLMTPRPPTILAGRAAIEGRFTYKGKPLVAARVELRSPKGRLLGKTVTDTNGFYHLAVSKGGLYEVRMDGPSSEAFHVNFKPSTVQQNLGVDFYADYCFKINITSKQSG